MNDKYPRGKFNAEDEGGTAVGIAVKDKTVIINFFKPMAWWGLDKFTAIKFAEMILEKANSIE